MAPAPFAAASARDHRRLPPGSWRSRLLLAAFLYEASEYDAIKGCLAGLVDDPETSDDHLAGGVEVRRLQDLSQRLLGAERHHLIIVEPEDRRHGALP